MKKIFAFDFDGTLTTHDTFLLFVKHAVGRSRFTGGMVLFAPMLILMRMRLVNNNWLKEVVFSFFCRGMKTGRWEKTCSSFAEKYRSILRPKGLEMIEKVRGEGAEAVIVTASIEDWVRPFLPDVPVIGTKIEIKDGRVTGKFATPNCFGAEKVRRISEAFPDRNTYHLTAFGDSRGDKEMLAFADEQHYKPFR